MSKWLYLARESLFVNSVVSANSSFEKANYTNYTNYNAMDDFEERAAIMEFDGELSREEAERNAWEDVQLYIRENEHAG